MVLRVYVAADGCTFCCDACNPYLCQNAYWGGFDGKNRYAIFRGTREQVAEHLGIPPEKVYHGLEIDPQSPGKR